jgi:predicted nucleic acid-binding protein
MGLILDSSIVIANERVGKTVVDLLSRIALIPGNQNVAISAIGLTELAHAIYRTPVLQIRQRRELYINDLLDNVEVIPYSKTTAMLAGKVDGEHRARGITIPSLDLLIGCTALEINFAIATINVRHFKMIPGLQVITI